MTSFTYVARDTRTGNKVKDELEAETENAAARMLVERGLAPLQIFPKTSNATVVKSIRNRVGTKHRVIFSRQLSTLINAGLPLSQSLHTVLGQTKNKPLQAVISKVISDVEAGSSFSDSLSKHPQVFNDVYVSLVAAGEASGTLDVALDRLALQQEKDAEIVSKVRGALIYPIMVVFVLVGVVIFMLTSVLPQVETLYKNMPGAELPFITQVLLAVSKTILNFWWLLLAALVGLAFGFRRWSKTAGGQEVLDNMKLHMWPVAPLFKKLYMARFSRTSATLTASGVPMIKMLSTTSKAVGNVHLTASVNRAIEEVKGGKPLSEALKGDPNFLDLVPDMIHIGEQSGQLDAMLGRVADYYEKEVDNQVKSISTVIEPVMMLVVGVMALVVVAAVLLPIYSLAGKNLVQR